MKFAKTAGVVLAGLVGLVVLVLLGVYLFVNPNNFKPRIVQTVKDSTGRTLRLDGDIKLSVFPWIALQLGPASLSSPPGFGDTAFVSFAKANVRVKLLPLLHSELEVDKIELDGLDAKLVKNAKGEGNWQMGDADKTAPGKKPAGGGPALQSIGGIKITHGRVAYAPYLIENFDLETGALGSGKPVPVALSLDATRGVPNESFALSVKLDLASGADFKAVRVNALNVTATAKRPGHNEPMQVEITVPALSADLDKQTLTVPAFSLNALSARLSGKLTGEKIVDDPSLQGQIALATMSPRQLAPTLGLDLPKTTDAKALGALSFSSSFGYSAKGAALDDLEIKLDDTTLKGNLKVALEKATAVTFKLAADKIDLDRYRPPPGATPDPKSAAADRPTPKTADAGEPLIAQGVFTLGAVHAAGLDLTNLSVTVDMKDNVTRLHPLEAQLYGGRYAGDLTYDARTATPALAMDEHLSGVDTAQLVANTHLKGRITGKANVNIKGAARGSAADDIMKTLTGHFDAALADGALEGIDIGYQMALAQSLLNKQASPTVQDTKRTKFDAFKDSATITNGVAETKDLSIISPIVKVAGQGSINLSTTGIDMTLLASVMKSATTTAVDIPLKVTGKYTDPTVRPDLEGVAKGAVKQKLNDVLKKNGLDLGGLFKK